MDGKLKGGRGFQVVKPEHRKHLESQIALPIRSDNGSAGHDMFLPCDVTIPPFGAVLVWSDVKSYMQPDEVLYLHIRSSIAIKKGVIIKNIIGVIDQSYYENPDNDGNIGFALYNLTDQVVELKAGERIAQAVFHKFLVQDQDKVLHDERIGGIGSSDR